MNHKLWVSISIIEIVNVTIVISSYQDDDLEEEKPKKAKITASKSRSSLLSKLPKAANDSATMASKLDIKPIGSAGPSSSDTITEEAEPIIKPSKPMSTTMFMPNSTKNRLQSQNKKVTTEVKSSVETKPSKKKKDEEDSDDDEPFFSFT